MKNVKSILDIKSNEVYSISANATIYKALELMAGKEIGALLVIDDGNIEGIISERDYARKVVLMGRNSMESSVKDIMTKDVVFVTPETTLEECMALMLNRPHYF